MANVAAETIGETETYEACVANALILPIARFDAVVIVRDEHGYGATLTDTGAVGLGDTAADALEAARRAEVAS